MYIALTIKELSEESSQIYNRFTTVFGHTYRRYLDLQQAEANAREAQIEAGLERVRARTMAMHSSEDVGAATATMFTELEKLGIQNLRGGITIIKAGDKQEVWGVTNLPDGKTIRSIGEFDMHLHPLWRELLKAKLNNGDYNYYRLAGKDKEDYINILNATPNYLSQPIKDFPDVHVQSYFFGEGAIWTNSLQPHSEEDKQVMKRFASVFSLTFRRYQDLQKAEAQAREATIEASLERVRGKAMAMHSSKDLATTIGVFYHELEGLDLTPRRCGVGLISKETMMAEISTMNASADGEGIEMVGNLDLKTHPVLTSVYNNWLTKTEYHPVLRGHEIKEYYQIVRPQIAFPDYPDDTVQYGYFFFFEEGGVYAWTEKELNEEELKIYRRFTSVLSLTYKRYKDLKDAEARTLAAIKDAALDRIRADIASMRTINDLDRITPLIWNELTILGIPFIRCGVFIMDEEPQLIHTFLSTPDGKAIAAFHLPYDTPGNLAHVVANWKKSKKYIDHWDESEFKQFAEILMKQGALASSEQYLKTIPKGGFYLHFLPFLQGMLYVGNTDQLKEEEIELIQHVADAFSTAYARYEDFNKLEAAKQQVEKTLTDLKQAQTQLVQSEKMASLGEMTAGIAHEIQNPLNFVNNFSEVSKELLDEMKTELETGNTEDAKDIADDVIQNLEKINHHGKRADAIVKSMLQHSRSSSGKKEPADINGLADEYLRLAYHGLRAKDKTFNAKFETEFDNNIGKINIISQDIGRVLVNLINNAFYAVSERKKQESNGYEPTVTVYTKKIADKIEIKVKDNGNGIPQKVLDKIFQPFFTTKPTGQGTGLGLSLAYDIVTKGHGGELKVETREGEGSEFIIQLPTN
jgi:signal transduction histidine kinase